MTYVGGIIFTKRVLLIEKNYDVAHGDIEEPFDNDFNEIIEEIINNRIIKKNLVIGMGKEELNETFNNYITKELKSLKTEMIIIKPSLHTWGVQSIRSMKIQY